MFKNNEPASHQRDEPLAEPGMPQVAFSELPDLEAAHAQADASREQQFDLSTIVSLTAIISDLAAEVTRLNQQFEERFCQDRVKEQAFERLYADLDRLKKSGDFERERPLLMDLILLYDRLDAACRDSKDSGSTSDQFTLIVDSLQAELLEILVRRGVVPVETRGIFDPTLQRATAAEPVENSAEHLQVLRVVRKGFHCDGRLLRAEDVVVKRFAPKPQLDSVGE